MPARMDDKFRKYFLFTLQINVSTSSVAKFSLLWAACVEFDSFMGHFDGMVRMQSLSPAVGQLLTN